MKKNDFILIAAVLAAALSLFCIRLFKKPAENPVVIVSAGGAEFGRYDLCEDRVIDINGTNTLVIKDGTAFMSESDCPDRLCLYQKPICKDGESIVCLPNRITVTVKSREEPEVDSVAN